MSAEIESMLTVTNLPYQCRVCGESHEVYISPVVREIEGETVATIELEGYHRLCLTDCRSERCGCERTHVVQPEAL